jgi:hypothetical protein
MLSVIVCAGSGFPLNTDSPLTFSGSSSTREQVFHIRRSTLIFYAPQTHQQVTSFVSCACFSCSAGITTPALKKLLVPADGDEEKGRPQCSRSEMKYVYDTSQRIVENG